jgi:cyclic dehypoxanthinyl futalosine synthase
MLSHIREKYPHINIHGFSPPEFQHLAEALRMPLRDTQDETDGFTAFICWTFQPEHTKLRAEPVGSSEYLRMQALRRISLDNIPNVQSSWVRQGPRIGQVALHGGANDFGSVMMEENVVSSADTSFRLNKDQIERLITEARFAPRRRDNWYRLLS